jgi:NAD(P)-dependent dehydrogenase (short-subunit alcohol dehydrogenase family)
VPDHDTYAYAAAKAGLHHLSRHLAGRLGPEGIVSNTIACGKSDLSFSPSELITRVAVAQARSKARVSSSRFISILGVSFT